MCIVFYHPTSLKCDIKGECYVEEVRKCKIDFSEKLSMELSGGRQELSKREEVRTEQEAFSLRKDPMIK